MKKIYLLLIAIFTGLLIYSSFQIFLWLNDNKKTDTEIKTIQNIADNSKDNTQQIDFDKLKSINNEVIGWVSVSNTNVDYPFVQHSDNSYYLTHSFYKDKNNAGWVFMDYRNKTDFSDMNSILYAHGRVDGTMFGSLKNTLSNDWYDKKEYYVFIKTPDRNYKFLIFSLYHIETTDDYLKTTFTKNSFDNFINIIKKRSVYNFNNNVNYGDRIITLSTCYNEKEKMVVHAKLVE